jgi:hypothetical protein
MHEVEPFLGKHGEKTELWQEVENECKKRDPTLFAEFEYRNGQDRLKAYSKFVISLRAAAKRDSGNDNQQPPTDLLSLIESLHDKFKAFEDEKKKKKNKNDIKKKDKEVANSVRLAALGCHTKTANKTASEATSSSEKNTVSKKKSAESDDEDEEYDGVIVFDDTDDDDNSYENAKKKAESSNIDLPPGNGNIVEEGGTKKKRRISVGNEHNARAVSLEETLSEQNRLIAENNFKKNELEKRRLTMEESANEKKFELEERRLKLEENRAEADKEDRAMNREMMMSMISMMKAMSENINSNSKK